MLTILTKTETFLSSSVVRHYTGLGLTLGSGTGRLPNVSLGFALGVTALRARKASGAARNMLIAPICWSVSCRTPKTISRLTKDITRP